MSEPPQPIRPRYDGAWIGAVVPALQTVVGLKTDLEAPSWLPQSVVDAEAVVLLVLDGLGWHMVRDHADHLPTLSRMSGRPITCAVPSTTATGLTSITTGLAPAQHGLLGYRIGIGAGVLNVLRWRLDSGRKGPDPAATQPVAAFGGHPLPTIVRAEFEGSGFSDAHLGGARIDGWQTIAVLRTRVRHALEAGERLVYAYYDGVDKVAHAHGLTTAEFAAELCDTDRLVAELRAALPDGVALVVTADHGHVEVGPDAIRPVGVDPKLVKRLAGESRFRSVWAKPNKQAALVEACRERHGDAAWVFTREELFDDGWLGPAAPLEHRRRIGDVVLAPFADIGFADPATPREDQMASRHGSLTEAEMLVPLLATRR